MTSQNKTWLRLRDDYLEQVEEALASVNHPAAVQVIDDVRAHLDRRFDELPEPGRTWENMHKILAEMGPPEEYADLLTEAPASARAAEPQTSAFNQFLGVVFVAAVIIIAVVLIWRTPEQNPAGRNAPVRGTCLPEESPRQRGAVIMDDGREFSFVGDAILPGKWKEVGVVQHIDDFRHDTPQSADNTGIGEITFNKDGTTSKPWLQWTSGKIFHTGGDQSVAEYEIRKIQNEFYLFWPIMNGDVLFRGATPWYSVLVQTESYRSK